ncbi:MAG: HAMP domain-containing histidine kinase [bacterium]|nr:HAMP domain-containing histidine kinase [bacterium]
MERVFERFYRVDGGKRESYPGMGLGLYISAEIVKRHRGTIRVESEEGRGSTFIVFFPVFD